MIGPSSQLYQVLIYIFFTKTSIMCEFENHVKGEYIEMNFCESFVENISLIFQNVA